MNLSIAPTIIGIILFAVGMFLFLRHFFKFSSVIYKPVGVFLIIVIGIQMIFSEWRFTNAPDPNTIIGKGPPIAPLEDKPADTYNVFLGVGEHDFTNLKATANNFIEANTFAGKTVIKIKGQTPIRFLIYPTLGVVTLPTGLRFIPFFKNVYKTPAYKEDERAITIKINITLGAVDIIEVDRTHQ